MWQDGWIQINLFINNNQHFYVIPKNVGGSYLVIESKNIKEFSFQAHYCPNNDGTNPTLTIDDSRDIKLEDSKITKYSYSNGMLKLNVKSNFEFGIIFVKVASIRKLIFLWFPAV